MKEKTFQNDLCNGKISYYPNGDLKVTGLVNDGNVTEINYWAAAPPTYGTSFYGSGHPYPNPIVAYDGTPNKGTIKVVGGIFTFDIKYPNAYYVGLGSLYIPPHINLKTIKSGGKPENEKYFSIQIDGGIPFRTLTYPSPPSNKPRVSPMFYHECQDTARTQESILRASAYPETNEMPDNFWGSRPPR
jgi:hypothetical protein